MKKILPAVLALSLAAGCKPGPVVIDGTILGYDGREVTVNISKDFSREAVTVAEDGTFHIEKMIDEVMTGGLSIVKGGSFYGVIVPGSHFCFTIDLNATPASWDCETDCQAEQDFYAYMRDTLLRIDYANYEYPEKFADYDAMWNQRVKDGDKRLKAVSNRASLRYFRQSIVSSVSHSKLNYSMQLYKMGLSPADDPDYMTFFNGIDLSDDKVTRTLLTPMINIKSEMYPDSIPACIRYVRAVDELAPTQHVKDSITLKYVDLAIKDGRISSDREGEFLLETAGCLVDDPEQMEYYRSCVSKALSLVRGRDAMDFPMKDVRGAVAHLSDFKGKVVYVDFWASWCIPCCMQTPFMKVIAEKYASNPQVVCISVSLDSNLDSWKGILAYDKPSWPQFVAEDGGSQIMKDYGFRAIPRFMIFDQEGRIVTVNAPRPQNQEEVVGIIDSLL